MGYAYGFGYGHTWRNAKRRVEVAGSGGGALLTGEVNGFATDFLYSDDTKRVALKASSALTYYPVDGFYQNAGTSPKMVYDVAGVLVWSPHNLSLRSQELDHTYWFPGALTATANVTIAPDGTLTADSYVATTSNTAHRVEASVIGSQAMDAYTYSIYAKPNGYNFIALLLWDAAFHGYTFNISTGVITETTGTPTSYSITALPNGWYRVSITRITTATALYTDIFLSNDGTTSTFAGDGVKGVYVWGAQLNRGTVPTAYLPTTTAARVGLALDYDPVTHAAKGLLCEPQATNLMINSSNLDSWTVSGAISCTPNTTVSPTGAMDADTVNLSATPTDSLYQSLPLFAGVYTVSIFAKTASGTKQFRLRLYDGVEYYTPDFTATTTWQRFSAQITIATSVSGFFSIHTNSGGTAGSVIAYGAQCESGTVATSYIPTLAATVTRAGDQVSVTPASINYSATAGSWWMYMDMLKYTGGHLINYPGVGSPLIQYSTTTFGLYDGAWVQSPTTTLVGSSKAAMAFQIGDRAITANGLAPTTDATAGSVLLSPGPSIAIGQSGAGASSVHGYIRQLRYLPRRKSGAELTAETV